MDIHREVFKEEAHELLADLESALLELEKNFENTEVIGRIFRALHTIKGSGAMFGYDTIAKFTHTIEAVFDLIRSEKIKANKDIVDLTLLARDQIQIMINSDEEEIPKETDQIIRSLEKFIPSQSTVSAAEPEKSEPEHKERTYRIRFKPDETIFQFGTNPLLLLKELEEMGRCHVFAHTQNIPSLKEINPENCYSAWDIVLTTREDENAIRDVFLFVEDNSEIKVEVIDEEGLYSADSIDYKKIGEILVERGTISNEKLSEVLNSQKRVGDLLIDNKLVKKEDIESAFIEQKHVREVKQAQKRIQSLASLRVPVAKLDTLVNLVGELVTANARLNQTAFKKNDTDIQSVAEVFDRLISELRENAMSLRMLPIGTTFNKFNRLVRDLSNETGKEVELSTEGAETELDKTVIEKLNDPLVHLIRNSIDHGIELPEERLKIGKARTGKIHLTAMHSGGHVKIQIKDDGAGLNQDAILSHAKEKGIILPEVELSEKEIFSLIFKPGFSTAHEVTNLSGRGVGMDVVNQVITSLRGSIDVTSVRNQGTTISLKIPLTLAIIDGFLVEAGRDNFVFPLSAVEECVELSEVDVQNTGGRHIFSSRGKVLPYIRLREAFRIDGERPNIEQIVITNLNGKKVGFVVDEIIGTHQTVIKSLGRVYQDIEGLSGATILGDGSVALILDVSKLAEQAEDEEQSYVDSLHSF